jgi:putative hydrolase of the HAD superfamily
MKYCLIFDADDTLWENMVHFESAIEDFLALVAEFIHPAKLGGLSREEVLDVLNELEKESIPIRGYGSRHFVNSLKDTFRHLHAGGEAGVYLDAIDAIGERLLNHPVQVRPGVTDTLDLLRGRHRLMLFTKGDVAEQSSKVERSGLRQHFDCVEIASEKNADAYHQLVARHVLDRELTFMIGNSPRSDVLPALAAGLWAVFVPHPNTWAHEHDEVTPHPRLLHAQSVSEVPALLARIAAAQASVTPADPETRE